MLQFQHLLLGFFVLHYLEGMLHITRSTLQASTFPTVVVYVMDTPRSANPVTFMSNMLYACSILYKTKLPFVIVMNKVHEEKASSLVHWAEEELFGS